MPGVVVGSRLDFRCGRSLLAYPIDRTAYGRLCRLITLGRRRAPKGECHLDLADLDSHGEGLILIVLPEDGVAQERREGEPRSGAGSQTFQTETQTSTAASGSRTRGAILSPAHRSTAATVLTG